MVISFLGSWGIPLHGDNQQDDGCEGAIASRQPCLMNTGPSRTLPPFFLLISNCRLWTDLKGCSHDFPWLLRPGCQSKGSIDITQIHASHCLIYEPVACGPTFLLRAFVLLR